MSPVWDLHLKSVCCVCAGLSFFAFWQHRLSPLVQLYRLYVLDSTGRALHCLYILWCESSSLGAIEYATVTKEKRSRDVQIPPRSVVVLRRVKSFSRFTAELQAISDQGAGTMIPKLSKARTRFTSTPAPHSSLVAETSFSPKLSKARTRFTCPPSTHGQDLSPQSPIQSWPCPLVKARHAWCVGAQSQRLRALHIHAPLRGGAHSLLLPDARRR